MRIPRVLRAALGAVPLLAASAAGLCDGPADLGRTPMGLSASASDGQGAEVNAQILCGEDAAMTAARVATHKRTAMQDGEAVLNMAKALHFLLEKEAETGNLGYLPPRMLDVGTPQERYREMKSGGMYSRRANDHSKKGEFIEAIADLLRALLRPNVDETAYDRLMATMKDFLKKAEKERSKKAEDGDLSDLFDAMEIEDNVNDNSDIDRASLKGVYRKLSVKYHPDKNPDSAARFNRLRDAYEILSDPVKTLLYDTGGMGLVRKYEGGGGDLDRTDNVELRIQVDLKTVYTGGSRAISHSRRIVCRSCRLQPGLPRCRRCQRCPGEVRQRQRWVNQHQYTVEEYEVPSKEKCSKEREQISVAVEKGMMAGDRVTHTGMASQKPGEIPGDLLVTIAMQEHPLFKRIDNDLLITVQVSLYEALLGFERELVHLDGHKVRFGVERGVVLKPGNALEILGEGMPLRDEPSSFGKLIVKFEIDFPKSINPTAAESLQGVLRGMGLGPGPSQVPATRRARSEL